MSQIRDYRQWSHEKEISMRPGELHEPYDTVPEPLTPELDEALNRVAQQDLGGGPWNR